MPAGRHTGTGLPIAGRKRSEDRGRFEAIRGSPMQTIEIEHAKPIADRALASLRDLDIPPTPANYAIWYDYHSGYNPNLKRTIDIILSNNRALDENTLAGLYSTFFSSAKEAMAVRHTSLQALETLKQIVQTAQLAHDDARAANAGAQQMGQALSGLAGGGFESSLDSLKGLIENLVQESKKMEGRSEYVGLRMRESAEKIEKLERNLESAIRESAIDALTGVGNRKTFDADLRKMAAESFDTGDTLALLMIDIDRFKRVNDTWGHPAGDAVLAHVAKIVQGAVRGEDRVARYGGEEFAVILPRTQAQPAAIVAENIRRALARSPIRLDVTPAMAPVTVSIGVACYEPGDSLSGWIERSDTALYRAKRAGRDRVEIDERRAPGADEPIHPKNSAQASGEDWRGKTGMAQSRPAQTVPNLRAI